MTAFPTCSWYDHGKVFKFSHSHYTYVIVILVPPLPTLYGMTIQTIAIGAVAMSWKASSDELDSYKIYLNGNETNSTIISGLNQRLKEFQLLAALNQKFNSVLYSKIDQHRWINKPPDSVGPFWYASILKGKPNFGSCLKMTKNAQSFQDVPM